ncbi:AAA family ATPase [Halomonas garicola]|uniref:AAA family ATPase n=1 Tax=Halomonas garicola TaxID=1690008 RepID=UPI00289E4687|nr:AAA family ATPase [Halomonas garicola]
MDDVTGFIGRAHDADAALDAIRRGANVLITGRAGIGKSAFLRHLRSRLGDSELPVLFVPAGTTKSTLLALAGQIHESCGLEVPAALLPPRTLARARREGSLPWTDLVRPLRRLPVADTMALLETSLRKRRFLVLLETLEVPPSQAELFTVLLDCAQMVACMDESNRRSRIEQLVWRFQTTVELKPLPLAESRQLAERWMAHHPLRFSDEPTRDRFLRHVAQASGGVPAAIRGLMEEASKEPEITPAKARSLYHQAGIQYVDMTPLLVVILVIFMATRYIARGVGEVEMLVLSGVATALFMGLRFFFFQMRSRR